MVPILFWNKAIDAIALMGQFQTDLPGLEASSTEGGRFP